MPPFDFIGTIENQQESSRPDHCPEKTRILEWDTESADRHARHTWYPILGMSWIKGNVAIFPQRNAYQHVPRRIGLDCQCLGRGAIPTSIGIGSEELLTWLVRITEAGCGAAVHAPARLRLRSRALPIASDINLIDDILP